MLKPTLQVIEKGSVISVGRPGCRAVYKLNTRGVLAGYGGLLGRTFWCSEAISIELQAGLGGGNAIGLNPVRVDLSSNDQFVILSE